MRREVQDERLRTRRHAQRSDVAEKPAGRCRHCAFTVLLFLLIACGPVVAQAAEQATKLVPCEDKATGRWGYCDSAGTVVISQRFAVAEAFSARGIAAVADDGWKYIDRRGEVVIRPFVFDNGPDQFREGLARFVDAGKIGFFGEDGRIVIAARFDFARPFRGGRAAVCEGCSAVSDGDHTSHVGGRWGFAARDGKLVIAPIFDEAEDFQGGTALVRRGEKWERIDASGRLAGSQPTPVVRR